VTIWEALILGVIQGATEFLPVSSSGHLVMGQAVLGLSVPGVFFEVAVHLATLVSVLVVYRERVARLVMGAVRREGHAWRYIGLLILATVPAAVIGVGLGDQIEALFEAPAAAGPSCGPRVGPWRAVRTRIQVSARRSSWVWPRPSLSYPASPARAQRW
jgi:undecaprenyl pyrophosphate phosphatase UppP